MAKLILIAAIILLTTYLVYIVKSYGIQKSISFTDYVTKNHENAFNTTLYYCGVALSLYGMMNDLWNLIVSGLCIIGVSIYSDFKRSKIFNTMHMIYAFSGFALLAITPILVGEWYYSVATTIITISTYLIAKTNKLWWTEIAVIYSSFASILLIN